ncbi:hypothetical protein AC578_7399 [Pseudocercospora eumusae]|uniref:J domain-containing protein n=1 Tax=Pseudocercospora eumusae TaxID=321146 RepID=A0A139H399_9PEZI|nr:hypothetical protein AC578_7399 [Pseudocercospora eumusae]
MIIVRSCISRRTATPCPSFHAVPTRSFHASAGQNAEPSNHYETLEVPTNATPAEIKKSFYKLSKANHPDLHPNDTTKSQRFVKVSEAYATLGSAEKKLQYDRDFLSSRPQAQAPSSSGPGARPASGLSRRKTQFRGPPPSFYRNGGWGEQSEKRREASGNGGMGPGGFATGLDDDVPHFDRAGHARTHESLGSMNEGRQAKRRRKQGASFLERERGGGASTLFSFFVVGGTLLGVVGLTGMVVGGPNTRGKGNASPAKAAESEG